MIIRYAVQGDFAKLSELDRHVRPVQLQRSIDTGHLLVMADGETLMGWLRYGLFWDELPFMYMLYFLEEYRGKGYGWELVKYWEQEMLGHGWKVVLTSTLASERGQDFFRKHGYVDCGGLLLPGEPMEIVLRKDLVFR